MRTRRVIDISSWEMKKLYNIMKEKDAIYMKEKIFERGWCSMLLNLKKFAELRWLGAESEASQLYKFEPQRIFITKYERTANRDKVKVL